MKTKTVENQILSGVIWKQLLLFFFPLLFGSFFQQLYNTADAIVVGRFVGKEALASVGGGAGTLINLFVGFFVGLSAGVTVTISQYFGRKALKEVSQAIHTAVAFAIAAGSLLMLTGLILAPDILKWMNTPEAILNSSTTYVRICFCGMISNLIYNIGAGILRALGDSKRPLYFLIVSCAANIILDILFVVVFGLGVAGAAIATILAQTMSAVLVCITLVKLDALYFLTLRGIRFHGWVMKKIVQIGLPAGIQSLMYSLSNILIQTNVNDFGTDTVAAWTAYGKIDSVFWMIISALGISITTFTGQNYGAGYYCRVRKGVRQSLIISVLITAGISVILIPSGEILLKLFTSDTQVIQIGTMMIRFLVPTYFTYIGIEIFSGALRGMGDAFIPMIMTCSGICLLRVIWLIFAVPKWHMITTVITCYPLTWSVTSVCFILYYRYYVKTRKIA